MRAADLIVPRRSCVRFSSPGLKGGISDWRVSRLVFALSDVVDAARGGAFGWPAVEARLTVELAADALCDPGFDGGADSPEGPNSARKGVGRLKLAALVLPTQATTPSHNNSRDARAQVIHRVLLRHPSLP